MDTQSKRLISDKNKNLKDTFSRMNTDEKPVFLMMKAEKLASAVYRVTDLIHHNEPLKWKLRDAAVELLASMTRRNITEDGNVLYRVNIIDRIVLFLQVSHVGSYVSGMNFTILKEEYLLLRTLITEPETIGLHGGHLEVDKKDILTERTETLKVTRLAELKDNLKGQKDTYVNTQKPKPVQIATRKIFSRDSNEKEKRRNLIISFIRQTGEVSIKEILTDSAVSSGVSSKTIQRELVDMVSSGILRKEGERRWSRYSLSR